jgi:AcrR family transcriptional regulator
MGQSESKKDFKRREIIIAASRQMNEQGATAISLTKLSEIVGLTRNALYYYFKDRAALIHACYLFACSSNTEDLNFALSIKGGAAEKLSAYIDRSLLSPNAERAVLTDLNILPADQRSELAEIISQNARLLESMFEEGISSKQLRPFNVAVGAQVIQGLLSWAQLWYRWAALDQQTLGRHYQVAADAIRKAVLEGISTDRTFSFSFQQRWVDLSPRSFKAFDPESLQKEKRYQLVGTASLLFNKKGIEATSFDDIADQLGATKGAVYHYFKDKKALVKACFLQAFEQYDSISEIALRSSDNPLEQLLASLHLNCQAQMTRSPPLTLQGRTSNLSKLHSNRATSIAKKMSNVRAAAIAAGLHSDIDENIITLSPGAFFWISGWVEGRAIESEMTLADEVCRIIFTGIRSLP